MRYQRARNTAWRRVHDQTIVLDVVGRHLYGLNETAARLWEALDAPRDAATLAGMLSASEDDVIGFLGELQREGLIEAVEASADRSDVTAVTSHAPLFVPPRIEWKEEMYRFGGSCTKIGVQPPLCDQSPSLS